MTRYAAIVTAGLLVAAASLPHQTAAVAQDATGAGQRLENCRARLAGDLSDEAVRGAIAELQELRALFHAAADFKSEVAALELLGDAYHRLGYAQESIDALWAKVARAREAGDRHAEADTLSHMGYIARDLGDFQTMLDANEQAVAIYRELGTPDDRIQGLLGLALAYKALNEPERSARTFDEADAVDSSPTRPSVSLSSAADQYRKAGLTVLAVQRYEQAAQLSRIAGRSAEESQFLLHAARLCAGLGEASKARSYINRALAYWASQQKEPNRATLILLGRAEGVLGDMASTLEYLDRAYAVTPPSAPAAADWFRDLGEAYRDIGEKKKAATCFLSAATDARRLHNRLREARLLAFAAEMERDLGALDAAREHIEAALPMFESVRGTIASPEIRSAYFSTIQRHYDLHIDVLMRLHQARPAEGLAAAALRASEHARGRSLLELLTEAGVGLRVGVDPELLDRERAAKRELERLADRRREMRPQARTSVMLEELTRDMQRATEEYERVEGLIRSASPAYASLARPVPFNVAEIQQQVLDADTLLLEYALGDAHSYLWVVSHDSLASFTLPPRAEVEDAARRVYELLTARNGHPPGESARSRRVRLDRAEAEWPGAAARLSQIILGPAASVLESKRLLIVAQGALQYIPFAALPDPRPADHGTDRSPVIAAHEVVYAPSASVVGLLREEISKRQSAPRAVAVLADPVFDADDPRVRWRGSVIPPAPGSTPALERSLLDVGVASGGPVPRLPFTRREASAIAAGLPPGRALVAMDFRASRETATSGDLAQYRIVHFATHALIDGENPALSGLVLSLVDERGVARDGFLRLQDVYNLILPADLVVMSACQTALGKDVRGEGLVGLTRGFMYAGAARVAASLWKLDDAATAELMARFYRNMLGQGLRPAAALRAAQMEMSRQKRWHDPYYWAAFQLQGEWK